MKNVPKTNAKLAQITGMIVTSIVVFGTDTDILIAIPLGIFAGALATFFMALADRQTEKVKDR